MYFLVWLVVLYSICVSPVFAASSDWKQFKPPTGELSVTMPAPVKDQTDPKDKEGAESYESVDDGQALYSVTTVPNADETTYDDLLEEFKKGLQDDDENAEIGEMSELKGSGWHGHAFPVKFKGGDISVLCTADEGNSSFVTLITSGDMSAPDTKKFFDSLQIDESKSKTKMEQWKEKQPSIFKPRNPVEWLGLISFCVGVLIFTLGSICTLIVAFRTSIWWGIGMLIVPAVGLFFIVTNFGRVWAILLVQLFSIILLVVGFMLGAK